ncbi:MAG: peptidoglycan-binding protein [Micropruina sp.]|uniref:peptidoglycan-binding protein n=1 Tax=Micropruina sp. TaxID=2737536 RepID=UPI0039E40808
MAVAVTLTAGLIASDVPDVGAATISAAQKAFIKSLVGPAQQAQKDYGVPASVSIAQAIADSDWGTSSAAKQAKNYFNTRCSSAMTPAQFAKLADAQVGKPYVLGAEAAISNTDPAKFDCSELVEWLYGRSGNKITDLAAWQYDATKKVTGSPKVGDLVFLRNNPARSNGIGHVAVLTQKLSGGDWRIIEARSRAYGVVRTTLSYWKTRKYYAGLRRLSTFRLAGSDGVTASAASRLQSGCVTISGTKYAKFSSIADSVAAHAAAVAEDSGYSAARAAIGDVSAYVKAVAAADRPKDAAGYAAKLTQLIESYGLRDHDVVPFNLVLVSGDSGAKVTAAQYLLGVAGYAVPTTGKYDAATVAAVKKFQKAKKLTVDGEAGPITLGALAVKLSSGAKGGAVSALATLLAAAGYDAGTSSSFTDDTASAVKQFQASAGRTASGVVDSGTWAALFMTLDAGAPKISGKPAVGQKLTVAPGSWGPGSVRLSYQWYRSDTKIGGATASSYPVTVSDAGHALSVRVTGSRRLYTTTVRISAKTAAVPLLSLSQTPTPTVSGEAKVGGTLTAAPGTWAPAPVSLAYQWYRGGARIDGATKSSYPVTTADAGSTLSVAVTASKTGYAPVTRVSAATAAVPRLLTASTPTISGTVRVGSTLTAQPGSWTPAATVLSYQWYRDGVAVKGTDKRSYLLTATDAGAAMTVKVSGSLSGYVPASRTSEPTAAVAKGVLTAKTPTIAGTRKVGKTLTANGGDWGPGTVALSYQWYRGSAPISGATKTSYKLTGKDKGATIGVVVRGTKPGYTTVEKKVSVTIAK